MVFWDITMPLETSYPHLKSRFRLAWMVCYSLDLDFSDCSYCTYATPRSHGPFVTFFWSRKGYMALFSGFTCARCRTCCHCGRLCKTKSLVSLEGFSNAPSLPPSPWLHCLEMPS